MDKEGILEVVKDEKYSFLKLTPEELDLVADVIKNAYVKSQSEFPKKCSCGRIYDSEIEYIERTARNGTATEFRSHALFYRDCACKSTIMLYAHRDPYRKTVEKELGGHARLEFKAALNRQDHTSAQSWKYAVSLAQAMFQNETAGKLAEFKENPDFKKLGKRFWKVIGVNIFRDIYNDVLRAKESRSLPSYRVLAITEGKTSPLEGLYIPDTRVVHRFGFEGGEEGLNENPEGTNAIVIDSKNKQKEAEFLKWLRSHDETNIDALEASRKKIPLPEIDPTLQPRISGYKKGNQVPVFTFADASSIDQEKRIWAITRPCYDLSRLIGEVLRKK